MCRLRVFDGRVLRRLFGPKRDKVTREWRKLHNEALKDLYSSILFKRSVVSAGGRLTINASPPGWTLRSVDEREQFGCDQG